ncbi:MAG: hypothetical protein HOP15_12800 [Planctomycetes bacterium]|nr:hypothetical protein [Planctomycetota bacterium]
MNATSVRPVALVLSIAGVALAALALPLALERWRGTTRSAEPAARALVAELSRRTDKLDEELASLRGELAALRAVHERGFAAQSSVQGALAPGASAREPSQALTPVVRAADFPHEFELRRELIRGFRAMNVEDREDALEQLAELARWGDEEARVLLAESLGDESAAVRARALKELAGLDEANLGEHLRATISDPSAKVRAVVASRLDDLPAEDAGPMLVGLLRDPSSKVVLEAIQSIDALAYEAARPFLAQQLQAESLEVATRAAQALRKLGDAGAALPTIQRILENFASDDVAGRVQNVKRLRRLRAFSQLESILAADASLAVREEARDALARIED